MNYYTCLIGKRNEIQAKLKNDPDSKILKRQLKNVQSMISEHQNNVCQRVFGVSHEILQH